MKKKTWFQYAKLLFVSLLFVGSQTSCDEEYDYIFADETPPVAKFSYSADFLEVSITNSSSHATMYAWDFGDGNTSDEMSPSAHAYVVGGTYAISLMVSDNNGLDSVFTQSITVEKMPTTPVASFGYTANFDVISFENTSTRATGYSWDFGDASALSTEESPIHSYAAAGTYVVTLTAIAVGEEDNVLEMQVTTGDAVFLSPKFEVKADWGGNYSTSGSPTPPNESTGAKLDNVEKKIIQTIRVYKNTTYEITFSAAIDGASGNAPFTVINAADATVLYSANLNESPSGSNNYVEYSVLFDSGDAESITVEGGYVDVTIRYADFNIVAK